MSLAELFAPSFVGRAGAAALECADPGTGSTRVEHTFTEIAGRGKRFAHLLQSRGVGRGDRLAFYLGNRIEIVDLWLGCTMLGVIVVPINVLYRVREIQHIVSDAEPVAVVTTIAQSAELPPGTVWWDIEELARAAVREPAAAAGPALGDDEPAALVYTSGTTGLAKGAILTHGNFSVNARALCSAWGITSDDRYLAALPLFHVHGLANGVHCWLASGCHMRLLERFDHATAADVFDEYRPTLFFGVPTMYVRMLDWPEERARRIGARTRLFVSGWAPLPAHVLECFRDRFGHVILERYGMTETLMNVSNPLTGERRPGTVGLPLPHVEVRVVDSGGADVTDGETGELLVRGPHVCAGYWRRPEATVAAFTGGWFRTGDLGVRASDGYITLEGRRSDLIISGGFNIYPRELEELLTEQPGVREAAVVGVPDPVRGELPVAYLVCDEPIDAAALTAHLRGQLASFKVPRAYVRVAALPRTALGKIQKHLLPPWSGSGEDAPGRDEVPVSTP